MTYRKWFEVECRKFDIDNEQIEQIMYNRGINPDDEAVPKVGKVALLSELQLLIPMEASVSEGGMSKSYNWDAIKAWISMVSAEVGTTNHAQPKIRNRKLW